MSTEYRVVWRREGWSSPQERVYKRRESAERQAERVRTAMSWQGEPTWEAGEAFEGPWEPEHLLYLNIEQREVSDWVPA